MPIRAELDQYKERPTQNIWLDRVLEHVARYTPEQEYAAAQTGIEAILARPKGLFHYELASSQIYDKELPYISSYEIRQTPKVPLPEIKPGRILRFSMNHVAAIYDPKGDSFLPEESQHARMQIGIHDARLAETSIALIDTMTERLTSASNAISNSAVATIFEQDLQEVKAHIQALQQTPTTTLKLTAMNTWKYGNRILPTVLFDLLITQAYNGDTEIMTTKKNKQPHVSKFAYSQKEADKLSLLLNPLRERIITRITNSRPR